MARIKIYTLVLKTTITIFFMALSVNSMAFESNPDRRNGQNLTDPAYFFVPLPYTLAGIGDGFLFLGLVSNIAGSTADVNFIQITGDAGGTIVVGEEIPLYFDWLNFEFQYTDITRANVNNYAKRGMVNTDKDDFSILEIGKYNDLETTLIFNFVEKRYNFYYTHNDNEVLINSIKDNQGENPEPTNYSSSDQQDTFTFELDQTDDHRDPRNGINIGISYRDHKSENIDNTEFYTIDINAKAYVPMGKTDTLVFNYFQSDAHVKRKGNTTRIDIIDDLGIDCDETANPCSQAQTDLVDSFVNQRTNGTASSLGGDVRLRSYPGDRFQGAHSALIGAEYRWNISQEATPFDYYIWKDVRTGIQVAYFAEVATVSELSSDLWSETRYSIGAGVRLITASGGVYRAELATGDEGAEMIIIFEYPWL